MPARWRVLIADDEPAARLGVRQLLAPYQEFAVVGECRDGRETLAMLERAAVDVLFLDIQMPEMHGFDVVRRRTVERMPATVFLTAYDQFALEAFDAAAIDYLVKPVSESRFAATMKRLVRRLDVGGDTSDDTIVVSTTRGAVVIPLRDIDWIEAADYYARVWVGRRSYLLRESLLLLERRVGERGFVRAHRQALVRLGAVRRIEALDDGEQFAVLASGARVPVSRRRRAAFSAALRAQMNKPGA